MDTMSVILRCASNNEKRVQEIFWDQVVGVYDIFVRSINKETHAKLRKIIADLIDTEDTVLGVSTIESLLETSN